MATKTIWLCFLLVLGAVFAQDEDTGDDPSTEELCENRSADEYFRLSTDGDCRDVVRCDSNSDTGVTRLASVRCPVGLAFDVDRQTCDWKTNVKNCDKLEKPRKILPILKTDEPICPDGKLSCGNGECIDKELFCNGKPDCKDESDENSCTVETDSSRAPNCDPIQCILPDCYCSADGTRIPGQLEPTNVPQMITITFNGAINNDNIDLYEEIFNNYHVNPNGCRIGSTFFVSHEHTNYSAVEALHRKGHEIGIFSSTHKDDPNYWSEDAYDDWLTEIGQARLNLERFANISNASLVGMRAPHLNIGGNNRFKMMTDQHFVYDASITASLGRLPIWPYSVYFNTSHKYDGNCDNCSSKSQPIWMMVMNELDSSDELTFNESLAGCHMIDSCNIQSGEQFGKFLRHNFDRHFNTTRAPLGFHFQASWLKSKKEYKEALTKFFDEMLTRSEVYFVTMAQVIQWMQNPTEIKILRDFQEWKEKCDGRREMQDPYCSIPHSCPLHTGKLPGETLRFLTCTKCPNPWILDQTDDGCSVK